jgi:hypothetical protein
MVAAASASTSKRRRATATRRQLRGIDDGRGGAAAGVIDESQPHSHDATGAAVPIGSVPVTVPTDANGNVSPGAALGAEIVGNSTAAGGAHEHGVAVPEQPVDEPTRQVLGQQLTTARQAAEAFPTVADALKAGYQKVTPFVPLIGAHYINFGLVDGTFDPAHPEMLLYNGTDPTSQIVGLSYFLSSPSGAPEGSPAPTTTGTSTSGCASRTPSSSGARRPPGGMRPPRRPEGRPEEHVDGPRLGRARVGQPAGRLLAGAPRPRLILRRQPPLRFDWLLLACSAMRLAALRAPAKPGAPSQARAAQGRRIVRRASGRGVRVQRHPRLRIGRSRLPATPRPRLDPGRDRGT